MSVFKKDTGKCWYWSFYYKDADGKRKQKTISTGVSTKGSKKEAIRQGQLKEEEFIASLDVNKIKHRDRKLEHKDDTIKDYAEFWLKTRLNYLQNSTRHSYETTINKHIIPIIGDIKLAELDQFDLEEFIEKHLEICKDLEKSYNEKKAKNMKIYNKDKPYTVSVKKIFHLLSMMLTDAVSAGAIPENPAKKVSKTTKKNIPKSQFKGSAYTLEEHAKLMEVAKGAVIEPAIKLAGYLGLRREEALALKWSNVDLDKNIVTICDTVVTIGGTIEYREGETKNDASNDVLPIIPPLREYLIQLKKQQEADAELFGSGYYQSDYVCRWNDGKPIKPNYVSHNFKKLLEDNNLRIIRFHDLRDTVVTLVWEATKDIKTAQIIARHAHIDMTADIYTDDKIKDKLEGLEQAFTKKKS